MTYPPTPIHRFIEKHAQETPSKRAVIFEKQQLDYAELNRRSNQLAHFLGAAGVCRDVRVAVCLSPCIEVPVCLLAVLKAGGIYVPLDPSDPAARLRGLVEESEPLVIITKSHLSQNLPSALTNRMLFLEQWDEKLSSSPQENVTVEVTLEQTAYLVFTSGTTGKPKGVMASQANLLHYLFSAKDQYGFNGEDIIPTVARFTFSISFFELLSPLVAGGTLLIVERDQVLNFKRLVQVLEQVTVIHASPSLWRKLLAHLLTLQLDETAFQKLRHVSSGGDMVSPDLLETMKKIFPKAEIFVIYGCTEVSCMACGYAASRDRTVTRHLIGRPFPNVTVHLRDERGNDVPEGTQGEIFLSGAGVTQGYLHLPELTEKKYLSLNGERAYRTGDLGRFCDGNLEIAGRTDFQIQLRGIRIEPAEIETQLRQAPGVQDAVVIAGELGSSEKSLLAYVVLQPGEAQKIEVIRDFLRQRLPDYMIPAAFVVLNTLPVNLNQKVDRAALPPVTPENLAGLRAIVLPRNETEKELVRIWEETLGVSPIGIQNNFFELGGDSLQAVQIIMEIEKRWHQAFPITVLIEAKSLEDLAAKISGQEKAFSETLWNDVVLLRAGGDKPPVFCLHGVMLYQEVAQCLGPDRAVYGVYLQEEVELIKTRQFDPVNAVFSSVPKIAEHYLRSIRSVQPHGPYYLVGSSFGGIIAFEMAQQLRAVGEEVALVALLDSWMIRKIPLWQRVRFHWDWFAKQGVGYLLNRIGHRLARLGRTLAVSRDKINRQLRPEATTSPRLFALENVEQLLDEVSIHAERSYRPRPYPGKLILFRALDQGFFSEDSADLGWAPHASGQFTIHNIPGDHKGILRGVSASILARQLEFYLNEKETPESSASAS